MAFDAGAIEATLTLNRNPFTAGLQQAKLQAEKFARQKFEVSITAKLDRTSLETVKQQINKAVGRINVKTSLDRTSLKTVQEQISRAVGRIQVKVSLDRASLAKVKEQIGRTVGRIQVKLSLDKTSLANIKRQLSTLDTTANVRLRMDRTGLAGMQAFNREVGNAADGMSRFETIAALVITLLPAIASGFTAAVGAVGALASGFVIAGAGAGALALVVVPTFKTIKKAVADGQEAINKLPDGLRQAANGLKELNDTYSQLVKSNQKLVAIGLSTWFNAGTAALKTLQPLIKSAANAFGDAGLMAIKFFESPWWGRFVQFLSRSMGPAVDMLFRGIFALIQIVGNLTRAFWDLGGSEILGMIVTGLEKFATWTERIGENTTFQKFMDAAVRSFPVVAKLLGEVVEFIFKLAIGLEPLGTIIVKVLGWIFEQLNKMPPEWLGAIALGFGAIWAAISLGATGPVGIAIGVLVGLGTILADLYTSNENFRTTINNLVDDLKTRFQPIWDTIVKNFNEKIKPAWDELVRITRDELIPKLQRFGEVIEKEVWPKIQPLVDEITGTLIPSLLGFLGALERIVGFLIDVFGPTIAEEIGSAITVFQGGFDIIAGALDIFTGIFSADWTTFTQGITEITRGFWTIIAGLFGTNLDGLKATMQQWDAEIDGMWHTFWDGLMGWFKGMWEGIRQWFRGFLEILRGDTDQGANNIGQAWRKIANLFRDPINWVINTVINDGIIGAWNQVMGWIGVGGISGRVPSLPAFAQGGPIRGGVAGKDSVPILTMPGEYVFSKRAVDNMGGPAAVEGIHQAARAGGDLPGFAGGGLIGQAITTVVSWWSQLSGQVTSLFNSLNFGHSPMGGMIGDAISGIPSKLVEKVLDAARRKLEALTTTIVTFVTGGLGAAANAIGLGGGGARAWIIAHESGGNPTARNPTSTASGLYQMINGTWKAYGGSTPTAAQASVAEQNAVADRYVAARYGSWENAQAFWQSHGYYDGGGILPPGTTVAHNLSGRPEAILTMNQLHSLTSNRLTAQDVAGIVHAVMMQMGVGGGDTYNVMLPPQASVRELADQLDFKRRVVSKGRYVR